MVYKTWRISFAIDNYTESPPYAVTTSNVNSIVHHLARQLLVQQQNRPCTAYSWVLGNSAYCFGQWAETIRLALHHYSYNVLAALAWAAGNILIKSVGKVGIVGFLSWSSLFAVPPLLLISHFTESPETIVIAITTASFQAWAAVLWQTIGNTLIGYGIWNYLLNQYPAALVLSGLVINLHYSKKAH